MECNKDEAIRAKEVAEKKMQNDDFEGAERIAKKALLLFPALDNISQMLAVCDVHICAGRKINGTEMDCYGILQVGKLADELTIKKQYRRLALILHPDKNKFPGAEAAFKMIGEANRVLSDKGKRSLYDSKCSRLSVRTIPTKSKPPPSKPSIIPWNSLQAFWTSCPFCYTRFQYPRSVMNKTLRCQSCLQSFMAIELDSQAIPTSYTKVPDMASKIFPVFHKGSARTSTDANGGASAPEGATQVGGDMRDKEKINHMKSQEKAEGSGTQCKKRKRNSEDSAEEGNCSSTQKSEIKDPFNMRKSTRLNETLGDDKKENGSDDVSSREKFKPQNGISSSSHGSFPERSSEGRQHEEACKEGTSISKDAATDFKIIGDPEFYNFNKDREKKCFLINQLWACYGKEDKMPRFYVVIRKVYSSEFKLRITWLEPHLEGQRKKFNLLKDLPISAGKFKLGNTQETTDLSTFSHPVHFEKGTSRGSYMIYPRKGETWAIFKNRKMSLSSEFEIVEIVSNLVVGVGIQVALLGKVKGFISLFKKKTKQNGSVIFPISDLLDFSHRIPSFRLTGNEREGVPKGYLELDPAAVPNDIEYCELEPNGLHPNPEKLQQPRKNLQSSPRKVNSTDDKHNKTEEHIIPNSEDKNFIDLTASSSHAKNTKFVSPASKILQEFYNFGSDKSEVSFHPDQIWAMYAADGLPKKYAQIKKIQSTPFRIFVLMLETDFPRSENVCGTFKVSTGKPKPFSPSAFSHVVKAEVHGNSLIDIYPKAGQVWMLDKNWDETFRMENCNYEIAEVLESNNEQFIKISLLLHLKGSKTIFKGARGRSMSSCIVEIPWKEVGRFCYQIPCFKFTTERNGMLRGCWELDPAAMPKKFQPLE
ncbi:uncharacterized protein LOC124919117 [Impatiens glandulifera]|uniref:uncharacterized protein LOC124919117 n=1 Tax=Impatiens glandulifera TaxID=253017 RepID=UPI001FB09AE4|nr:uncharacterized protein LOC124919117 [Impatiens glandulifera]XP_047315234.1 uncharacterized protein LOC124919117 [Impatiens glandulifera]